MVQRGGKHHGGKHHNKKKRRRSKRLNSSKRMKRTWRRLRSKKKPRTKKNQKCYVVFSKSTHYRYGAFPFSEEGKIKAEKYAESMAKKYNDEFFVIVK